MPHLDTYTPLPRSPFSLPPSPPHSHTPHPHTNTVSVPTLSLSLSLSLKLQMYASLYYNAKYCVLYCVNERQKVVIFTLKSRYCLAKCYNFLSCLCETKGVYSLF